MSQEALLATQLLELFKAGAFGPPPAEINDEAWGNLSTFFLAVVDGDNQTTARAFMDLPPTLQRDIAWSLHENMMKTEFLHKLLSPLVSPEAYVGTHRQMLGRVALPSRAKKAGAKRRGSK